MAQEIALAEPDWPVAREGWGAETAAIASAKWHELNRIMAARGWDGPEIAAALEIYAHNFARYRMAEAHVAENGPMVPAPRTGVPMHNPYLAIANAAAAIMRRLDAELMLSPRKRGEAGKGMRKAKRGGLEL